MDWRDVAGKVGAAAPILGTLLGGPAGAAVGGLVAAALGTGNTADDVSQAMATNPDAAVKLRQIESDERVKLQAMLLAHGRTEIAIAYRDRVSARDREVRTGDVMTPRVLAGAVTLGFFGVLVLLLVVGKPAAGGDALLVMLGALGGAWTSIVSYYFGSSAGSAVKTELMSQAVKR